MRALFLFFGGGGGGVVILAKPSLGYTLAFSRCCRCALLVLCLWKHIFRYLSLSFYVLIVGQASKQEVLEHERRESDHHLSVMFQKVKSLEDVVSALVDAVQDLRKVSYMR